MFKSTGTIKVFDSGWVYISVCPELTRYYLSRFNRNHVFTDIQLMTPKEGGHITIVRTKNCKCPDVVKNFEYLSKIKDKIIEFEYFNIVTGNGKHFWLDVECNEALDIREKLSLDREPFFNLHLTIGVIMTNN